MIPDARPTQPRMRSSRSPLRIASTRPKPERPRSAHQAGPKERRRPGRKYTRQSAEWNRKRAIDADGIVSWGLGNASGPSLRWRGGTGFPTAMKFLPYQKAPVRSSTISHTPKARDFFPRATKNQMPTVNAAAGPRKVHFVPTARPREAAAMTQAALFDLLLKTRELTRRATADRNNASPTTSS